MNLNNFTAWLQQNVWVSITVDCGNKRRGTQSVQCASSSSENYCIHDTEKHPKRGGGVLYHSSPVSGVAERASAVLKEEHKSHPGFHNPPCLPPLTHFLPSSLPSCPVIRHFYPTPPFACLCSPRRDLGHLTFIPAHGKSSAVSSPSRTSPSPECKRDTVLSHTTALARQKSEQIQADRCFTQGCLSAYV